MSEPQLEPGDYYCKRPTDEALSFEDGWEVEQLTVDSDGENFREVVAYVDTESLADALLRYLTDDPDAILFTPEEWR